MLELPAGMLDDEKGDFVGTAVREVSNFFSPYVQYINWSLRAIIRIGFINTVFLDLVHRPLEKIPLL